MSRDIVEEEIPGGIRRVHRMLLYSGLRLNVPPPLEEEAGVSPSLEKLPALVAFSNACNPCTPWTHICSVRTARGVEVELHCL
jgi:hypothetical protein